MTSGCSQVSQRSTRRRLRVEQKALRHSVRGAVHLSMRRVLGMHRSSTTSALEPSASVISLCQSSSFGHAQSCTGCLASPQFVRSRNRSGEPRHDHPHELASRIQRRRLASSMPTRVRDADADETPPLFADAQDRSWHFAPIVACSNVGPTLVSDEIELKGCSRWHWPGKDVEGDRSRMRERISDLIGPFRKASHDKTPKCLIPRSFSSRPAVVPIVNISERAWRHGALRCSPR